MYIYIYIYIYIYVYMYIYIYICIRTVPTSNVSSKFGGLHHLYASIIKDLFRKPRYFRTLFGLRHNSVFLASSFRLQNDINEFLRYW